MLTATTADPRLGATRRSTVRVVVRRRRVLSVLLGSAGGFALWAAAGVSPLWWLAALFAGLTAGYLGLVARLRHLRVRRRIDLAFGSDLTEADEFDWRALERELHLALAPDAAPGAAPGARAVADARSVELGNRDLGRFLLCWALGWILTPVVTVIRLARRDQSILERRGIAHRIVRLQQFGRAQSLRVLTVGAAASVGITAVGGLTTTATAGTSTTTAAVSTTQSGETQAASTYTVVPGDTLSAIARRSGASVSALAAANHLADPNLILVGETLSIVGDGSTTGASYLVRAGDTLSSIALRDGTTIAALVAANGIANPNLIFPGQVLALPPGVTGPTASAPVQPASLAAAHRSGSRTAALPATPATRGVSGAGGAGTGASGGAGAGGAGASGASGGSKYVIRPGDTMAAVARRYGTTVGSLSAINHIATPNRIYPGQVLTVPSAAANAQKPITAPVAAPAVAPRPVAAASLAAAPLAAAPVAAAPVAAHPAAPVAPAPAPAVVAAKTALSALPLPLQFLRGGSVDQGVDYTAPGGTPLYAMGPGKIIREGMSGFGPNCPVLEITAGPLAGKTVYYGHAGANLVHVGDTVAAGQQISVVGYGIVGYSTGPHLEIGFYPPGGNGSGQAMLGYVNTAVGHSTGG